MSASIDQRVSCWRKIKEQDDEPVSYLPEKVKRSNVADIQASLVVNDKQTQVMVCVGIGIEVFQL